MMHSRWASRAWGGSLFGDKLFTLLIGMAQRLFLSWTRVGLGLQSLPGAFQMTPIAVEPEQCVFRTSGIDVRPGEPLALHCVGLRAVTQHCTHVNIGVAQCLRQQMQTARSMEDRRRQVSGVGSRVDAGDQFLVEAVDQPAQLFLVQQQVRTAQQFISCAVLVEVDQLEQAFGPAMRRWLAERGRAQPEPDQSLHASRTASPLAPSESSARSKNLASLSLNDSSSASALAESRGTSSHSIWPSQPSSSQANAWLS